MLTSQTKRVLSSVLFLPLFVYLLVAGTPFHFMLLAMAASLLGLYEFFSLQSDRLTLPLKATGYVWCLLLVSGAYTGGEPVVLTVLAGGVLITLLMRLLGGKKTEDVVDEVGYLYAGIFYVVFLLAYLVLLRGLDGGNLWVLSLFFITWGGDTAAYYTGRRFGKRRLYPEVSPKKSIEGFLGGFAGGILVALIFKSLVIPALTWEDSLILGAVIGIIGPLGDLCESLLKRSSNVKDSGGLIPGHGGILDRIDSILFSAPFVYYFVLLRYGVQS